MKSRRSREGPTEPSARRRLTARIAVTLALTAGSIGLLPRPAPAGAAATRAVALGQVRYIDRGLSVQPPRQHAGKGKLKQSVYSAYLLSTQKQQKASVGFRDGTVLNLNQLTDALVQSLASTRLSHGEVEQMVKPGSAHRIVTPAATASAVGTQFDVRIKGKITIVTVIEGAVLVTTKHGRVVVTSGEQTRVPTGKAPSTPIPVNAPATVTWAAPIPPPSVPLGTNVALAANGGSIVSYSSQRVSSDHAFDATNLIDGDLTRGWQSGAGLTTTQSVTVAFQGATPYPLTAVLLDCVATGGEPASDALKDFTVAVSSTGTAFTPILSGTCAPTAGIQTFALPAGTKARELELLALDNQGGSEGIAVAEMEVISPDEPHVLGTPTPSPTPTATSTPTPTSSPTVGPSPTSTPTATAISTATSTPIPLFKFSFSGLTISYTWEFSPPLLPDPQGPIPVKGTACGSDPLTAKWSGTITYSTRAPFPWNADFSAGNPAEIDHPQGITNGIPIGQVIISLQLIPGTNPSMALLAILSGHVDKLAIAPSQVPIAVASVASC